MTKISKLAEAKIIATNSGYWDGVSDRARQQLAPWYRGTKARHGHYDVNYAAGYEIGVFGGDLPPFAVVEVPSHGR